MPRTSFTWRNKDAAENLPRLCFVLDDSVDLWSAEEIVAAVGAHRLSGFEHVAASGSGVVRLREKLGPFAEIGLVVVKGGRVDAFASRSNCRVDKGRREGIARPSPLNGQHLWRGEMRRRNAQRFGGYRRSRRARPRQFPI